MWRGGGGGRDIRRYTGFPEKNGSTTTNFYICIINILNNIKYYIIQYLNVIIYLGSKLVYTYENNTEYNIINTFKFKQNKCFTQVLSKTVKLVV